MINTLVSLNNGSVIRNMLRTGISIFFLHVFSLYSFKPVLNCIMSFSNDKMGNKTQVINTSHVYTFWHVELWKHITKNAKQLLGTISSPLPISITPKLLTPRLSLSLALIQSQDDVLKIEYKIFWRNRKRSQIFRFPIICLNTWILPSSPCSTVMPYRWTTELWLNSL